MKKLKIELRLEGIEKQYGAERFSKECAENINKQLAESGVFMDGKLITPYVKGSRITEKDIEKSKIFSADDFNEFVAKVSAITNNDNVKVVGYRLDENLKPIEKYNKNEFVIGLQAHADRMIRVTQTQKETIAEQVKRVGMKAYMDANTCENVYFNPKKDENMKNTKEYREDYMIDINFDQRGEVIEGFIRVVDAKDKEIKYKKLRYVELFAEGSDSIKENARANDYIIELEKELETLREQPSIKQARTQYKTDVKNLVFKNTNLSNENASFHHRTSTLVSINAEQKNEIERLEASLFIMKADGLKQYKDDMAYTKKFSKILDCLCDVVDAKDKNLYTKIIEYTDKLDKSRIRDVESRDKIIDGLCDVIGKSKEIHFTQIIKDNSNSINDTIIAALRLKIERRTQEEELLIYKNLVLSSENDNLEKDFRICASTRRKIEIERDDLKEEISALKVAFSALSISHATQAAKLHTEIDGLRVRLVNMSDRHKASRELLDDKILLRDKLLNTFNVVVED